MSLSSNGAAIKREKHERTAVGGWPPPFSSLEELDGIRGIRGNLENRPSSSGFEDFTANSIILPIIFEIIQGRAIIRTIFVASQFERWVHDEFCSRDTFRWRKVRLQLSQSWAKLCRIELLI